MRRYAEKTKVPVNRSKGQIETLLKKHGAENFAYGTQSGKAMLAFQMRDLLIRIVVPVPKGMSAKELKEERRIWRALLLIIKAKLEAVQSGVALFEDEWLAYTVMPDGQTVGQWAKPQLSDMRRGKMPPLLTDMRQD